MGVIIAIPVLFVILSFLLWPLYLIHHGVLLFLVLQVIWTAVLALAIGGGLRAHSQRERISKDARDALRRLEGRL